MSNQTIVAGWTWRGRIGFILLALWVLLVSLGQLSVPMGQLVGIIPFVGFFAAVCLIIGV